MRKYVVISLFLVTFTNIQAYADAAPKKSCSIFEAVYVPATSKDLRTYDYQMTITKAHDEGQNIYAHFLLSVLNRNGSQNLTTVNLTYGCSAGSVFSCKATIPNGDQYTTFDLVALNKNFEVVNIIASEAPDAIILPNVEPKFYYYDWTQDNKSIQYQTPERVSLKNAENLSAWIFKSCK